MTAMRLTISSRARRGSAGFTLMEILIALAIFGAGLIMSACLFPAAVSEHQKAVEYTLGTIMCNNGVALARVQLKHNAAAGTVTDPILDSTQPYPSDNPKSIFGFKIKCEHTPAAADLPGGKFSNNYSVTVTPCKADIPFAGVSPLVVKTPLSQ
ncbi:MAG: prepilin-type N-terminal cleavage/methylation domain-containing protein [Planctomycetota bacterium]|nr:prepilin-type N-terminal cleavage/methylation domain-containing protein [Planctomycetota bacterium]